MINRTALTLNWAVVAIAAASPFELQIDSVQSDVDLTLCMTVGSTLCDTDSSPLGGSVTLEVDCLAGPVSVTLHDFVFEVLETVSFQLDFGFPVGQFNATASDVVVMYAQPGIPLPEAPLVGDAFGYTGVPADGTGQLDYTATMLVCFGLIAAGHACDDIIDLSTLELDPLDLDATLAVMDRDVTVVLDIVLTAPLDPEAPDLGYFMVDGTLVASGTVPGWQYPPGDLDSDDDVDLADFGAWVGCLLGPDEPTGTGCACADLDLDNDVDLADYAEFQSVLPAR